MATKANLKIDQGTDFSTSITLTDDDNDPVDLSSYTGEGQIRKYYTSTSAVDWSVSLGGNTGVVTISLTANTTNNIAAGRYVYDIEITNAAGIVSRILEGIVTVTPGVTR
jgi:hypothetical protein